MGLEVWGWGCGAGDVGQALWGQVLPSEWWDRMRRGCGAGVAASDVGMWGWRCGAGDVGPGFTFGVVGQDEEGM